MIRPAAAQIRAARANKNARSGTLHYGTYIVYIDFYKATNVHLKITTNVLIGN